MYFSHLGKVFGENDGVVSEITRVHVELVKRIEIATDGRGGGNNWSFSMSGLVSIRLVSEVGRI